jgi:glycine reductase
VRHGGYDTSSAAADPGVTFPVTVLRELAAEGAIGELHAEAFSFPGATAQKRIIKESGPAWARMLADEDIDLVLLVPV